MSRLQTRPSAVRAVDRRTFPRMAIRTPIQIVRPDAFAGDTCNGTLVDISQSGLRLETRHPIPVGEWIVIRPAIDGAGFGREVVVIVQRTESRGMGRTQVGCRFPERIDFAVVQAFL